MLAVFVVLLFLVACYRRFLHSFWINRICAYNLEVSCQSSIIADNLCNIEFSFENGFLLFAVLFHMYLSILVVVIVILVVVFFIFVLPDVGELYASVLTLAWELVSFSVSD